MIPQVDFDIADSILRVLEGWEPGNKGLYRKYWSYKKIKEKSKIHFGPGNPKNDFSDFPGFFTKQIRKSGNRGRKPWNLE